MLHAVGMSSERSTTGSLHLSGFPAQRKFISPPSDVLRGVSGRWAALPQVVGQAPSVSDSSTHSSEVPAAVRSRQGRRPERALARAGARRPGLAGCTSVLPAFQGVAAGKGPAQSSACGGGGVRAWHSHGRGLCCSWAAPCCRLCMAEVFARPTLARPGLLLGAPPA